jgi:hypothetical protein
MYIYIAEKTKGKPNVTRKSITCSGSVYGESYIERSYIPLYVLCIVEITITIVLLRKLV